MSKLFSSAIMGDLVLKNRIVLAPLTRCRSPGRVPNELNAEYYEQRSTAGLIISEATSVCPMGIGYLNTPGIWSTEQIEGWKGVTKRVHKAGGIIFLQLWHVGRMSHPMYLDGKLPVAPSAIAVPGNVTGVRPKIPNVVPRPLEENEIPEIVEAFRKGAENAKLAGFDGVEVHGANAYLPDQFLRSHSNKRTDQYGGSVVNRARFLLEVTDAVVSVWGAGRVGVHISPRKDDNFGMDDSNPKETFGYLAEQLKKRQIAFICAREFVGPDSLCPSLKEIFGGFFIANEMFTKETAEVILEGKEADAVAFGALYIANPDLVHRFKVNADLNQPDPSTFFSEGPKGYTDYPFLNNASES